MSQHQYQMFEASVQVNAAREFDSLILQPLIGTTVRAVRRLRQTRAALAPTSTDVAESSVEDLVRITQPVQEGR